MNLRARLSAAPNLLSLRRWNLWLAGLYALQGVVLLVLSNSTTVPVDVTFVTTDSLQSGLTHTNVLADATKHMFDANVGLIVAVVLLLSAAVHVTLATWQRVNYEADLARGTNRWRWFQIGLANALMLVIIALLTGNHDLESLKLVFAFPIITALLCLLMELQNPVRGRGKVKWGSYGLGFLTAVLPWLTIAGYLLWANVYGSGDLPTYVYVLAASVFVLLGGYGLISWLQLTKRGPWKNYLFTECSYMLLAFTVQTIFAWQVFAGLLR